MVFIYSSSGGGGEGRSVSRNDLLSAKRLFLSVGRLSESTIRPQGSNRTIKVCKVPRVHFFGEEFHVFFFTFALHTLEVGELKARGGGL